MSVQGNTLFVRIQSSRWIGLALIAVVLACYIDILYELIRDWIRDANYRHGFIIPLVSGFLIWRRRDDARRLPPRSSPIGVLGIAVASAMLVVGSAGAEVFTQRVSLVVLLASLVLFLYGWRHLRLTGFAIALLLLAIPLPYVIYYGLTAPMQAFAAKCAIVGLRGFGIPAVGQGNIIHLSETSLEVAEACSGIRSLYAFLAVGALVANATHVPLLGRLGLFLLTIPLAVAGNAVRVFGSGLGAWLIGPEATHGTIHEIFGLVVFAVSLGIFMLLKRMIGAICSSDGRSQSLLSRSPVPTPPSSE